MEKFFSPELYRITHSVEEDQHGMRLDQFMMQFFEALSREHVKKKIRRGEIFIHGRPTPHKSSTKVAYGDTVTMHTHRHHLEDEYWQGEKIPLDPGPPFLFENQDFLILSKPAFMSTHPTGRHLFYCATVYVEHQLQHKVYGIHRLDRETSGLLCLAKNLPAASEITNAFELKKVRKAYFLIGKKDKPRLEYHFPLLATERLGRLPEKSRLVTQAFSPDSPHGKEALTEFELLYQNEDYVLALAFPLTGRQHQIRVHAAHHGFPLLGDKIYNGDPGIFGRMKDKAATAQDYETLQLPRHALHAMGLQLPLHEKTHLFIDQLPTDLQQWMQKKQMPDLAKKMESIIKRKFGANNGAHPSRETDRCPEESL